MSAPSPSSDMSPPLVHTWSFTRLAALRSAVKKSTVEPPDCIPLLWVHKAIAPLLATAVRETRTLELTF